MSVAEKQPNEQRKNSSEKDTNLNSDIMKKYIQESPHSDNNDEEEKPVHFKEEYDKNKYYENQIESSPEQLEKNNTQTKSPSEQKEQKMSIIIITII